MVHFRLIGPFARLAGFREKEIIIDSPRPLKSFEFVAKFELLKERMIILVNGESATIEAIITNNDSVKFLPVIGGG